MKKLILSLTLAGGLSACSPAAQEEYMEGPFVGLTLAGAACLLIVPGC